MTILTKPLFIILIIAVFAIAAIAGGPGDGFEVWLMRHMAEIRVGWPELTEVVAGITNIGGAYVILSLIALASVWLLLQRAPGRALLLALTVLIERTVNDGLKLLIGRPRPTFGLNWHLDSLAFPSGHSANSLTAFLMVALILAPPARRGPWTAGALLLALIVGLTRIYLGVHWPSDVVGGWAFGLLAVSTAILVGRRWQLLPLEQQHEVVGRHRPARNQDEAS